MKNSLLVLCAAASLGAAIAVAGPASAHPLAPPPGLTDGSAAEPAALRRSRRYHAPQRVMGLAPGPDRRRPRIRLPR